MTLIFIGFIFVLLDLNISVGQSVIGLIPDFVGYLFIYLGLREFAMKGDKLGTAKIFSLLCLVLSLASYILDILAVIEAGAAAVVFAGVQLIMGLYLMYLIVFGLNDIEKSGVILDCKNLLLFFYIEAGMSVLFFAAAALNSYIGIGTYIVTAIYIAATVLFLGAFLKTKRLFEAQM